MKKFNICKATKLFILLTSLIIFLIFINEIIEQENRNNITYKLKFLNICLNNQTFSSEIAVWTLLTDGADYYGLGAIKLLKSMKKNVKTTKFDAFVLELVNKPIRPKRMRDKLLRVGWRICQVNRIAPRDEKGTFGRFRDQFTKLLLWNITEFKANYYFDSDTFVLRNIDNFFTIHNQLDSNQQKIGCTRDWSPKFNEWSNGFNMGVFVLVPDQIEFNRLIKLKNDFNFTFETSQAEQGFLNVVYENLWLEIGFENNANLAVYTASRDYWNEREKNINVIHYTMNKAWACTDEYKAPCDFWRDFDL